MIGRKDIIKNEDKADLPLHPNEIESDIVNAKIISIKAIPI